MPAVMYRKHSQATEDSTPQAAPHAPPFHRRKLEEGLRRFSLTGNRTLWAIIVLGVIARIVSAIYQRNTVVAMPGVFDQISYHKLALRVLEGNGFSFDTGWWPATPANQPTAHWSFLYVLFLAAIYFVTGPIPLAARLIQAILTGILIPLLSWRIGRRLFGPKVGIVSAALSAFYVYFIYYAGALVTESFFILAVLWVLDIATALVDPSHRYFGGKKLKPWLFLGLAFASATLFRQAYLLLVPFVLAWIAWQLCWPTSTESPPLGGNKRYEPSGVGGFTKMVLPLLGHIALTVLIVFALIIPWTVRNYRVFGQFVLLNTNAGFAFFWGNHPIHGTGFIPLLPGNGSTYGNLIPEELRGFNEARLDRALLLRGLAFVREDPARYLLLCLSRVKEYFKFWPSPSSGILSNWARVLSFGVCLPFLLYGLLMAIMSVASEGRHSHQQSNSGVILLLLVSCLYSLIHLMTWTLVRYRLPVDAMTMPFTAFAIAYVFDRFFGVAQTTNVPHHSSTAGKIFLS